MQKSKWGISVGLLATIMFLSGLLSYMVLFLIAGYILLFEENEWLRKTAVKAMLLVALVAGGIGIVNAVEYLLSCIGNLLINFPSIHNMPSIPLNLGSIITYALRCFEYVMLILLAVRATSQGTISLGPIDKMIDRHSAA